MGEELEEFFDKVEEGEVEREKNRTQAARADGTYPTDAVEEPSNYDGDSFTLDSEKRWASDNERFWACKTTYDVLPAGLYKP
ncbi:hypothetical protein LCGC14_2630490, partial [marine sediment metagenome]